MSDLYCWDGDVWVKTKVVCGECKAVEWVEAILSGSIGDGGKIDLKTRHELPDGWKDREWDSPVCLQCRK